MKLCVLVLLCLACGIGLAGCSPSLGDLATPVSADGQSAEFPALVPLAPLLAGSDADLPRSAAGEGASLESRAADLRRRAAVLQGMAL